MRPEEEVAMLRNVGLVPTIQRLAILDWLWKTEKHPTADQILEGVQRTYPSISRATVYNTLDVLTKAGMILRLHVEPGVARYDADLSPHAHFRCRICGKVYDLHLKTERPGSENPDGHLIESIRTYAYGICAACRKRGEAAPPEKPRTPSSGAPDPTDRTRSVRKKPEASSSVPPQAETDPFQTKEAPPPSSNAPDPPNQKEGARNA